MFGFFSRWHSSVSMVALLLASSVGVALATPAGAQEITSGGGAGGDYPSLINPNGHGAGGGGGYGSGGTGVTTGQAGSESDGGAGGGGDAGSGGAGDGTAAGLLARSYVGANGGAASQSESGSGGGGTGLILTGSADTNNHSIIGGSGGGGAVFSAPGGGGGTGLLVRSDLTATINGSAITGGSGGQGKFANGGGGGAGAFLTSGGVLNNVSGSITGGAGGSTVYGNSGSGGAGVLANGGRVDNSGAITGGAGAVSIFGGPPTIRFDGGAGGGGVEVWGSSVNNIAGGTITGGNGGDSTGPGSNNPAGGNGGHGVSFRTGAAGSLTNDGTITGGNGGNAASGNHGVGGAGVVGADLTIINSGTIIGGMNGDGTVQADAITFTGGANKLTVTTAFADFYGAIGINGGGTLTLDQSGNNTEIFSDINGDGSVIKTGAATVLLSGINSYSGGTTITQGVLEVDGPQPLGTGTVTMNGGTLRVATVGCGCGGGIVGLLNDFAINTAGGTFDSGPGILILIGNITDGNGPGTLTITGSGGPAPGFVIFAGNNIYSGPTHVTADGVLLAATSTALSPNSAYIVDGILDMGGYDATFAGLSGASTGQVGSSGFGNPVTLTINVASGTSTYNGIILDGGSDPVSVVKTGAGKQVLAGINAYTGTTTVNGGILSIDGSIALSKEVIVNAGGTLSGNGIVSTTTINAGGTLAPGNSIGTLTVQGDLTFKPGSTYQVEVSPSNADRVNVSGIATLNGATLSAIYEPGAYVTKRHTVLNAAGGVNGTFSGPVNTNLPTNFSTALNYDNNNAYLDLTLNYVPPTAPSFGRGLTVNQANVGTALVNSFNTAGGIPLVLGGLTAGGLTQASGESATGIQQATFNVMDRFLNLMTDPYASGRTTAMLPMSYAPLPKGTQPLMVTQQPRWSVWAAGYGGTQTTRGNAFTGSNTNTAGIYGFAAGADYRVSPDTILGFALGGAGTSYHLSSGLGSGSSNVFQAGIYGRHTFGPAYVAGSLAYGWQDVTTDRRVMFDQLRARFNAHMFSGRLETGYRFATPFGGLTPYAAGQFTNLSLPAYQEQAITGPGVFALSYGSKSVTAWRSELGLRGDKAIEMGDATLVLRGRLAWAHDFNPDRSISASFLNLPASGFIVNGAALARNAALVSAGAEMKWHNGWSIAGSFEGSFSNRSNGYAGKGALRYQW